MTQPKGFTLVEALLVITALVVITGMLIIWQAKTNIVADKIVATPTPTPYSSVSSSDFVINEWNIEFTRSHSLEGLEHRFDVGEGGQDIGFSSPALQQFVVHTLGKISRPDYHPCGFYYTEELIDQDNLGVLLRSTNNQASGDDVDLGKIGDYYYRYAVPSDVCSTGYGIKDEVSRQSKLLIEDLKTLKLIKI